MKTVIRIPAVLTVVLVAVAAAVSFSVSVGIAAPPVAVTINPLGSKVILSWPGVPTNLFYLESSSALGSAAVWRPTADPGTNSSAWSVTNDAAGAGRFYRLHAWEVLFDGTSISAFRGYQQAHFPGTNIWRVTASGELEAVAGGVSVDLITTNQYADFELRWEWKAAAGGNSGVNYRATEDYSRAELSGPEWQLLDDPGYAGVPPNASCGAVWGLVAPTNKTLLPVGRWNECRLLVQSNHVEHWLNGRRVVAYELDSAAFRAAVAANASFNSYPKFARARAGHVAIRHENRQVWFRNIKIRALAAEPSVSGWAGL